MLVPSLEHRGLHGLDWDVVPRIGASVPKKTVIYLIKAIPAVIDEDCNQRKHPRRPGRTIED